MAHQPNTRAPLQWTGGYYREPVWPREPSIAVIKALATHHLQAEFPATIEDDFVNVSFFTEGLYNKLYKVSYPGHHPSYLLRVTLPVEPYFKTESEVATIAYLRAHTSVPVPRVIAWQSNIEEGLGYEWMLMEVIDGVPLQDVWRKMPWDRKLEFVDKLAGLIKELQDHKFDSIGALYFKSTMENGTRNSSGAGETSTAARKAEAEDTIVTPQAKASETSLSTILKTLRLKSSSPPDREHSQFAPDATTTTPRGKDFLVNHTSTNDFAIGPLFDPLFFKESRPRLSSNRGPYPNATKWLQELINVQIEWIKNPLTDSNAEYGSNFAEEAPAMLSLCDEYANILPTIFPNEETKPSYVLHHSDLNLANILVNPETFAITGIVDWEMVNVVPYWKAKEYPEFMIYQEPLDEEEPPVPDYEDEDAVDVSIRDRWDYRLLRQHWDKTMKRLRGEAENQVGDAQKGKADKDRNELLENIAQLTDDLYGARSWLKKYTTGKGDSDDEAEETE